MSLEAHTRQDGMVSYSYKFRHHGRWYRGGIGVVSKAEAQRIEQTAKARAYESNGLEPGPHAMPTFNEYAPIFMTHARETMRERAYKVYEHRLMKHILPLFGMVRLSDVSEARLGEYRVCRTQEGASPRTLNGELSTINVFMKYAVDSGVMGDASYRKVPWLKGDKTGIRVLTREEEERLLNAATPHLRPLIRFALQTGLALEELLRLTWENIDLPHRQIRILSSPRRRQKSRTIPLNTAALHIIDALKSGAAYRGSGTGHLVFGYHSIAVVMDEAVKKSGLHGVSASTLRQTFAYRCLDIGLNLLMVQRWLGHSSIRQMERYLPKGRQNEQQAIEKLRTHFWSQPTPPGQYPQLSLVLERPAI